MKHVFHLYILFALFHVQSYASGASPLFTVNNFPPALNMPMCAPSLTYYKIAVESPGAIKYVLDVRNGYLPSGGKLQLWELWGGANQIFYALSLDKNDNFAFIRTILNHLCIEATTQLTTQNCNNLNNYQKWTTEYNIGSSLCKGNQDSFLVGKIMNGNTCLGYGTYNSNNFTVVQSSSPPQNWNDVGIVPCSVAPRWRLLCMNDDNHHFD